MNPMIARVAAAQATLDRFNGRRLDWSRNDCARLAAHSTRKLGHQPPIPKAGAYRSLFGAKKALEAAGFPGLVEALDSMFPRIAYAAALPADLIAMPAPEGHDGWVALALCLGNGRILGFSEDPSGGRPVCRVMTATFAPGFEPVAAWRVDPCPR